MKIMLEFDDEQMGERVETTLTEFIRHNEDGLGAHEIEALRALSVGESYDLAVHAGWLEITRIR
jgi:hypothetical protein